MAGVYFYVPGDRLGDAVTCGIKLSEFSDHEEILPGSPSSRRVLTALLNPNDVPGLAADPAWRCVRISVDPKVCWVGDRMLYRAGLADPAVMERYRSSLTLLSQYRYGSFRHPECLIPSSVLSDGIEVTGRTRDIPVLYRNSEALYLANAMERVAECLQDDGNDLLFAWHDRQAAMGHLERHDDAEAGIAVFMRPGEEGCIVLAIPDDGRTESGGTHVTFL